MKAELLSAWSERGVKIPEPGAVEVGDEVAVDALEAGTVLHAGTKIFGERTHIGPGCELGRETPMTVENCQLGEGVKLKGGYAADAVFLDGAAMGSGAHVRGGTILEEGSEMAHTVGLKQTIFFPYVVGGSLINFCDALMAGGYDRKRHSEIGSSYIHFNYTPRGDKATASLFGDVPRGVMLDQAPIFLGGQGGTVGPVRVEYGTVVGAGSVLRGDVEEPGQLVLTGPAPAVRTAFSKEYRGIRRILRNGMLYLGNMAALAAWYREVRAPAMGGTPWGAACAAGGMRQVAAVRKERVKRLGAVMEAVGGEALAAWAARKARAEGDPEGDASAKAAFFAAWEGTAGAGYVERVRALGAEGKAAGTKWLQSIVDAVAND